MSSAVMRTTLIEDALDVSRAGGVRESAVYRQAVPQCPRRLLTTRHTALRISHLHT